MKLRNLLAAAIAAALAIAPIARADDINSTGSYSETDAGNSAAPPNGWPAGMVPSAVEPAARANMGAVKRFWDRINPVTTLTSSAGTYTYTTGNFLYPTSYSQGETFCAKANSDAIGNDSLQVNTLSALPIYKPSLAGLIHIVANDIKAGQQFCIAYDSVLNASTGGWQLISPLSGNVQGPSSSVINDVVAYGNTAGSQLIDTGLLYSNFAYVPGSVASGNLATFTGTGKQEQDSGVAVANVALGAASATANNFPKFSGTGGKQLADGYAPSDSTKSTVAMTPGSGFTAGHLVTAADSKGTLQDSGATIATTKPTQTLLASGSGTYTVPANVKWIYVRMVGGGGGGGGSDGAGGTGGTTTFNTVAMGGGGGGAQGWFTYGPGGTGGIYGGSGGSLFIGGASGSGSQYNSGVAGEAPAGGAGGSSPFGGAGGGGVVLSSGYPAYGVSGSGGGGAAGNQTFSAAGGGAGGYLEWLITSPAASYSYAVGAQGGAGAGGSGGSGGTGGGGLILIEEHYNP